MKELNLRLGPKRVKDDRKRLFLLLRLLGFICQWLNDQLLSTLLLVGCNSGPSLPKGIVFFFWVWKYAGSSFVPFKCKAPTRMGHGICETLEGRKWTPPSSPSLSTQLCPLPLPRKLDSSGPKVALSSGSLPNKALEQGVMCQLLLEGKCSLLAEFPGCHGLL